MSQTHRTDTESGALVTLNWHDELVHNERMWHSASTRIVVAIAGTTNFLLRIPAAVADGYATHFWYRIESTGQISADLYENPTITLVGNARPPVNVNRESAETTAVTCFSESTIGVNGTYLTSRVFGAAKGKAGGVAESGSAWHGSVDEDYLLVVTTHANDIEICVTWRFHEEI